MWHGNSWGISSALPLSDPAQRCRERRVMLCSTVWEVLWCIWTPWASQKCHEGGGGAALLPILQMKLLSLARASYVYLLVVPPIDDRRGRPGLDWSVPLLFFWPKESWRCCSGKKWDATVVSKHRDVPQDSADNVKTPVYVFLYLWWLERVLDSWSQRRE